MREQGLSLFFLTPSQSEAGGLSQGSRLKGAESENFGQLGGL